MKMVTAIINPVDFNDLHDALRTVGVDEMTISEVKDFGRRTGHREIYRAAEYQVNYVPKVKIEVAVAADQVDEVIGIIGGFAKTGAIGDGRIFVFDLDRAVCIRAGETVDILRHADEIRPAPAAANAPKKAA